MTIAKLFEALAHADKLSLILGGVGLAALIRQLIAMGLKIRAKRMLADEDKSNDDEAKVIEETADKLSPK